MSATPPIIVWMQSLSDPIRARLLRLLDRTELTVAELCSVLQLPQSTVSRHLKVLGDENWISSRREGTSNLYRMRNQEVDLVQKKLWGVVKNHGVLDSTAEQDDARLEQVLETRRSKSQVFFSTSAEKWDRLRSELFGHRIDAWTLGALLGSDAVIGDLGCGTGGLSQVMAPWVKQIIAVDSSSAMIQTAKKRLRDYDNVDVRKGELSSLPIEDECITASVMALVLPYVVDPTSVLAEVHRVTKISGRLVLIDMVPHDRSEYREQMGHCWFGFSEEQIREWLVQSGWDPSRYFCIPPDPDAKGPGLFITVARRTASKNVRKRHEGHSSL